MDPDQVRSQATGVPKAFVSVPPRLVRVDFN